MPSMTLTSRTKSLVINKDSKFYGTFAEIGAGQEVARHFFQAGLASQSVAKTMSAYDKTFSDAIYGKGGRFVSEFRLLKMLKHEYELLEDRLSDQKNDKCFFVFANTVATSSHEDNPTCHGWMGIRFQKTPSGPFNDVVIHVRMLDRLRLQQQEALGILGVNLIYGCHSLLEDGDKLVASLIDNLSTDRLEIDFIRFTGPDVEHIDNRLMSLELLSQNITRAILFDPKGRPVCPADGLYHKNILIQRGAFRPVTITNVKILENGLRHFSQDINVRPEEILSILEITMTNLKAKGMVNKTDFLQRVDTIGAVGQHVLISNYPLFSQLKWYLRKQTGNYIALVAGALTLEGLFNPEYYSQERGGILGAFGYLFDEKTKMYIYPFKSNEGCMTSATFNPPSSLGQLYKHVLENKMIVDMKDCDDVDTSLHSEVVRKLMSSGDSSWEKLVPEEVKALIIEKGFFKDSD